MKRLKGFEDNKWGTGSCGLHGDKKKCSRLSKKKKKCSSFQVVTKKRRGIILFDKLNTCGKFMCHFTKNMDRKVTNANKIGYFKTLKCKI